MAARKASVAPETAPVEKAPAAPPCVEASRVVVYERLGKYFDWVLPERLDVGRCTRCGAVGVAIVNKSGKGNPSGPCLAQDALTSKRYGAAEGVALEYGAKLRIKENRNRGDFAIAGDNSYALIEPDRTYYIGSIVPSRPLPPWLDLKSNFKGPGFLDLLRKAIEEPRYPFMLAYFTQKGDIPFEFTQDENFIVVNGAGMPQRLDRARLLEVIDLVRTFGRKAVEEAVVLKEMSAKGDKDVRKAFQALRDKRPEIMARFAEVPGKAEPERAYAFAYVDAETPKPEKATKAAKAKDTIEDARETGEGEHACA